MINVIGAGLAGLSAAITLAERGVPCRLVSLQRSERAQSVLAEGGINAALDTMGEQDSPAQHYDDTMRGGAYLADPNAVAALTENAPAIVRRLWHLGAPLDLNGSEPRLRNFGGQKKKRTAFAGSSTGKILMSAVIDEARRFEAEGLIKRYLHHELLRLLINDGRCSGALIRDCYSGCCAELEGAVLLACGGLSGLLPGRTTGTTQNTGDAAAAAFAQGVLLGNPEMIQYHPTTIGISGKRCLITEAARGEGGRLLIMRGGEPWYFMEEKYPELGSLMPRDVVSREMYFVRRREDTEGDVMLDMRELPADVWRSRLADLRDEIIKYTGADPAHELIAVHEGIHYFMGGIDVDERHRTNISGLYAAGECCCQYHGANRLGGNSMLGAVFGGEIAAVTASEECESDLGGEPRSISDCDEPRLAPARDEFNERLAQVLSEGLGIVRSEQGLKAALDKLAALSQEALNVRERDRAALAEAMLRGALARRESRGAHYREDYPERDETFRRTTTARRTAEGVEIAFRELPERRPQDAGDT